MCMPDNIIVSLLNIECQRLILKLHVTQQFTSRHMPKGSENIYVHKNLYIDAHSNIFRIVPKWKQHECPSNEWMNKMWFLKNVLKEY